MLGLTLAAVAVVLWASLAWAGTYAPLMLWRLAWAPVFVALFCAFRLSCWIVGKRADIFIENRHD